jgi:Myelodysplasia-myeloid leukemia factor 1-interacting protein
MEEQHTVSDGRTGAERMTLTRGLGDRQRTLERARRAGGPEQQHESLRGIQGPEAAQHFDREWQAAAAGALPPEPQHAARNGARRRYAISDGRAPAAAVQGNAPQLDGYQGRYV